MDEIGKAEISRDDEERNADSSFENVVVQRAAAGGVGKRAVAQEHQRNADKIRTHGQECGSDFDIVERGERPGARDQQCAGSEDANQQRNLDDEIDTAVIDGGVTNFFVALGRELKHKFGEHNARPQADENEMHEMKRIHIL